MSGNLQSFHLIYRRQADDGGDGGMRFEYIKRTTAVLSRPSVAYAWTVGHEVTRRDSRERWEDGRVFFPPPLVEDYSGWTTRRMN